jgi:hypothetical protein
MKEPPPEYESGSGHALNIQNSGGQAANDFAAKDSRAGGSYNGEPTGK